MTNAAQMPASRRVIEVASLAVTALTAAAVVFVYAYKLSVQIRRASEPPVVTARVGARAPQFAVATTAGLFDLAKVKQPVVLEIFATWCQHCQREVPTLNRLYARYRTRVAFVGVSGSDTGMDGFSAASENDLLAWRARFRVMYPVAYDSTEAVARRYVQDGFPTIAIIDRQKIVRYLSSGETSESTLDAAVRDVER